MLVLPNNLKCLAKFADTKESGARWAVTGINVEVLPDNRYALAATDTKSLILVEGTNVCSADEYPKHGALENAIDTGTKALIPFKVWETAFADSAKHAKNSYRPALKTVAVTIDPGQEEVGKPDDTDHIPGRAPSAVLGWTNLELSASPKSALVEGRFPPYRDIIKKSRPLLRLAFDPMYFIRMGKALADLAPLEDSDCRAEFDFYGSDKQVIVRMYNGTTNQTTTLVLMPFSGDSKTTGITGFMDCDGLMDDTYWSAEAKRFKENAESSERLADARNDLLIAAQKEIRVLKAQIEGNPVEILEGVKDVQRHIIALQEQYSKGSSSVHNSTIREQNNEIYTLEKRVAELEQELDVLRALGTVEHPPTGTEELTTDDEDEVTVDDDDSEVEDVVEAEHDTDVEVVSESTATDDVVPASDDPFDVFAASLGL